MPRTKKSTDQVGTMMKAISRSQLVEYPEPPIELDDAEIAIYDSLIRMRTLEEIERSPKSDFYFFANLARQLLIVDGLQMRLKDEGAVLTDPRGKAFANPVANLLDSALRGAQTLTRSLQVSSTAQLGTSDESRPRREKIRKVEDTGKHLGDDSMSLLAGFGEA